MAETEQKPIDIDKFDIPEGEFCVHGTVYAFPEHADKLNDMYKETTRLAQDEEGVVYYCISRDQKDPSIFHFFERYKSKDAFRKHNEQAVVIRLINSGVTRDITASFAKAVEF